MKFVINERKQFELVNNIIQKTNEIVQGLKNRNLKDTSLYLSVTLVLVFLHQVSAFLPMYFKIKKSKQFDFDLLLNFEQILTHLTEVWRDFDSNPEAFYLAWNGFLEVWDKIYNYVQNHLDVFDFHKFYLN